MTPDATEDELAPMRGCLWAVALAALFWLILVAYFAVRVAG